jgi:hypothetical protein
LVGLFALLSGLFPFWATRFAAREKEGAIKTAVFANLVVGLIVIAFYVPLVTPILSAFNINNSYLPLYLLAAFYIFDQFLVIVFESCIRVVKPHAVGYGLLIEEVTKVALAYVFILILKDIFLGAIVGLIVGASIQAVFYIWVLKDELKQKLELSYLREWLRSSPVLIYNTVGSQLGGLTLYLLVFFAGQSALGDYQAAITFSTVIGYASSLAFALYPKMLARECPADVATSFKTMIMLALPMAAVAIAMSGSLLTILNVSYAVSAPILMLLAVDSLIVLVSQFYSQCLLGTESLDVEGKISLHQLIRSKIFKVFSLSYIQAAIALPILYVVLTRMVFANPVVAVEYLIVVNIVIHSATFIGLYSFMRKAVSLPRVWGSLGKYTLGALAAVAVILVLPRTTTLIATLGKALTGAGVYGILLYTMDSDARTLVKQIWDELKETVRPK